MRPHKALVVAVVGVLPFAASAPAARAPAAATTFGELAGKVKPGRTVYVTDDAGGTVLTKNAPRSGQLGALLSPRSSPYARASSR